MLDSSFVEKCTALSLNPDTVARHIKRLKASLLGKHDSTLGIVDTCRIDNGGVIDISHVEFPRQTILSAEFVDFIPAAGASTRFFKPFTPLLLALRQGDWLAVARERAKLRDQGVLDCDLAPSIHDFIAGDDESELASQRFIETLSLPKALQVCSATGQTFLNYKLAERNSYEVAHKSFFVINPAFADEFSRLADNDGSCEFLFQGPELSTVRVDSRGEPILVDGKYSPVPAGHGALTKVLEELKAANRDVKYAFIRNIDNTPVFDKENISKTRAIAEYFNYIVKTMAELRQALDSDSVKHAEKLAYAFLTAHNIDVKERCPLRVILSDFFHRPAGLLEDLDTKKMRGLFAQPVNLLGQVPNSGKDIGGSPVFIDSDQGRVKLCIELPHVSEKDRHTFLEDSRKMTHFNPVFVFSELSDCCSDYDTTDSPFWIVAKKSFLAQVVYYHETVLYELLGNSALCNPVFIEIPRRLFKPNKSIYDSRAS